MNEEMTEAEEVAFREQLDQEIWEGGEPVNMDTANDVQQPEVQAEDEWAGVSPALRQSFEAMRSRMGDIDTLHVRLKQAESRIGGAERRMHEAALAKSSKTEAPTAEQIKQAADNAKEWEELKGDFPEWANAMDSIKVELTRKTAEIEGRIPDVEAIREALKTDFDQQLSAVQKSFEVRLVDRAHRGWKSIVQSPEYTQWLATQPTEVQMKTQSDSADDAIEVLDSFKEFKDSKKSPDDILRERNRRLESAAADNRQTRKPSKTKSEDDMTDAEYRAFLDQTIFKT